ncbi:hypothetical protein KNV24_gp05 [Enterococcus phage AE4_17]|uniref:Uncharacterized protein n=1 Tax=Enterococcus phage AE4_17 TaxID=2759198 RepID=A0A7L7SNH4_9CAUD|nr:hypothetical protein KNV24_gp05 [Enterococcus phage AE4_17]QNR52516.1 hypothetical protein [Enterococcus phage ZEF1]QOC55060.1 hypothetical protein [Enterococcus phage AE4_17]
MTILEKITLLLINIAIAVLTSSIISSLALFLPFNIFIFVSVFILFFVMTVWIMF